ncbi:MAG: 2-oxoglutarate and iron-dependent oxygenase domain-containing protein [Actinomycetes bacterium]
MSRIPIIDIAPWFTGDAEAQRAVAMQLNSACHELGFLQIVGHGVSHNLRQSALDQMNAFFESAVGKKAAVTPTDGSYRGYSGRKSESFAYTVGDIRPADLVEAFVMGSEDRSGQTTGRLHTHAPNIWPDGMPDFRDTTVRYYEAARELSETMADIASLSLGLERDFFSSRLTDAVVTMRMNWYQRLENEPQLDEEQMALGAHTDYGILTILLADVRPGLQILSDSSEWVDVTPEPGAFIMNVGDALAVWTNDYWKSTIHRVVPTMAPGGTPRRSIALFQDGNFDTPLSVLPQFVTTDKPARYAPTTLGEHVTNKISGGRTFEVPDVQQTLGTRDTSVKL